MHRSSSSTEERKPLKRPVVSELDGMQQGGLVFILTVIGGLILVGSVEPDGLLSFWVWFTILLAAVVTGVGAQKLFVRTNPEDEE